MRFEKNIAASLRIPRTRPISPKAKNGTKGNDEYEHARAELVGTEVADVVQTA